MSYGEFDWYDVETVQLPNIIGLVGATGPPGHGLAVAAMGCSGPVLGDRLAPGCTSSSTTRIGQLSEKS